MTIGRTPVNRAIAMQPAPDGGVFMVWPSTEGGMEIAHMGVDGEILLQQTLPVGEDNGREPQLQVGLDGRLHILWRQRGVPHATIQYGVLLSDVKMF
jgi:hypothetical protein